MLNHLSFSISDLNKSGAFYDAALNELSYIRVWTYPDAIGYGLPDSDDKFAIKKKSERVIAPSPGFHVAFTAKSREAVDAFYAKALECGGKDNGAPGLRIKYGPNYYAAFVSDPDGYPIEALFNEPLTENDPL